MRSLIDFAVSVIRIREMTWLRRYFATFDDEDEM